MSGLDNQNQLPTTIQGVQEYYQAHKQEWIQQVVGAFLSILRSERALLIAVDGRDSIRLNNVAYKFVSDRTHPDESILDFTGLQYSFRAFSKPGTYASEGYSTEPRLASNFTNPVTTAGNEIQDLGLGLLPSLIGALRPVDLIIYDGARFEASKQAYTGSFDEWYGAMTRSDFAADEEHLDVLNTLRKDFNQDLNLAIRDAMFQDLYEQVCATGVQVEKPSRSLFHVEGGLALNTQLKRLENYTDAHGKLGQRIYFPKVQQAYTNYQTAKTTLEAKIAAEKADVNDPQAQKAANIRQALLNEIQLTAKQADLLPSEYCREVYEMIAARAVCHSGKEKEEYHATQNEEVSRLQSLLAYDFFRAQLKSLNAEALSEPRNKTEVLGAVLKPIQFLAEDLDKRAEQIRSTLTDLEGQSDDKTKKRIAALYEELRQVTAGIKSCSQFIGAKNLQEKAQVLSALNREQARHPHKTAWVRVGVAAVLGAIFIGLVVLTLTGVMPAFPGLGHASKFIEAGLEGVVTAAVAGAFIVAGLAKGAHVVFTKDPKGAHIRQARAAEAKLEKQEAREAAAAAAA